MSMWKERSPIYSVGRIINIYMKGPSIAGMSTIRERVDDDFYATPEESTKALLSVERMIYPVLEPACGQGHIAKLLGSDSKYDSFQTANSETWKGQVDSSDLIDRGFGKTGINFLEENYKGKVYGTIITNPPFNLFQE